MNPVLFDTSVYITALRQDADAAQQLRHMAGGAPIWLSAVVLEELCAGADARSTRAVQRLSSASNATLTAPAVCSFQTSRTGSKPERSSPD